jgi:hypothetical protein
VPLRPGWAAGHSQQRHDQEAKNKTQENSANKHRHGSDSFLFTSMRKRVLVARKFNLVKW